MRNNLYIMLGMLAIFVCNVPLTAMHESVRTKIESLRVAHVAEREQHKKSCFSCRSEMGLWCGMVAIDEKFTRQVSKLVLNAGDLVSNQEKLNYGWGDQFYPQRKEIIKKMIGQGEHPNNIVYQVNETPLKEATLFKDQEFIQFLRQHGANK